MNTASSDPHQIYVELILEKTLNNRALAKTLFEKLFDGLPAQVEDLSRLLNGNDTVNAQKIIHDIHGIVASCGLVNLEYYAGLVEKLLFDKNLVSAKKSFRILEEQIKIFLDYQEDILNVLDVS